MQFGRDIGIEATDGTRRTVALAVAHGVRVMDDLALQVRQRDMVVVDDAQRPDAGRREVLQHGRAESAGSDHEHARAFQLLLAGAADLGQHDVTRVALEFDLGEGRGGIHGRDINPAG